MDDRPTLRALVSYPVEAHPDWYSDPALVSLELAAELHTRGYMVLIDPADERELTMWEMERRSMKQPNRKWFEAP